MKDWLTTSTHRSTTIAHLHHTKLESKPVEIAQYSDVSPTYKKPDQRPRVPSSTHWFRHGQFIKVLVDLNWSCFTVSRILRFPSLLSEIIFSRHRVEICVYSLFLYICHHHFYNLEFIMFYN